jgi:hypothetical protein|tara:strand:+ start:152 stop:562 length:411 start_codon:yes stop_codon:yes gene_type:complete
MSDADKLKVTSWSLNLYLSDGTKVEATNLPSFTSAAIDDYCTDIDSGKITPASYRMKMTESGYYYKDESNESWKNEPLLGHGIGFQDLPLSTPGAYSPTSGSHLHATGSYESRPSINKTTDNVFWSTGDEDDGYED